MDEVLPKTEGIFGEEGSMALLDILLKRKRAQVQLTFDPNL